MASCTAPIVIVLSLWSRTFLNLESLSAFLTTLSDPSREM